MRVSRAIVSFLIILLLSGASIGNERSNRQEKIVHDVYTLDYFIELVEKIEEHPKTNSKTLTTIANYIRKLKDYEDEELWGVLIPGSSEPLPGDVLSKEEKKVLINMVSHGYSETQEHGVLRTRNNDTIAMGHVINGICAGAVRNKRQSLYKWNTNTEDPVDNLFAATMARTITRTGLAVKNNSNRVLFGPGGSWVPSLLCPKSYKRNGDVVSSASDAQVLGDVDGFLLGDKVKEWTRKGVRLGQLLRMYYSSGVCYDRSFVDCYRLSNFKSLVNKNLLFRQAIMLAFSYHDKYQAKYPNVKKGDIVRIARDTTNGLWTYLEQISQSTVCKDMIERQGCDLPANIVFIMDESGSIGTQDYSKQKIFVNIIISKFDISPRQTRVAVVEYSDKPRLSIDLGDYGSKTRLKCAIDRFDYKAGVTHTGQAIKMVHDQILRNVQNKKHSNQHITERLIPQIVILLTDGKSNDVDTQLLKREIDRIKKDIQGLTMIAVGIGGYNLKELEMVATDPDKHVFEASDFEGLINLVTSLQNRTCSTSVELDIDFHEGANQTVVSAFVFPNRPRYFFLPYKMFKGIRNICIEVTPVYGTVAIFASRSSETPGPENYTYKIDPLNVGEQMVLYISDPCGDYSNTTCPSVYLAIYGSSSTLSCSERVCSLPNQIKFTIKKGIKPVYGTSDTSFHKSAFLSLVSLIAQVVVLTGYIT